MKTLMTTLLSSALLLGAWGCEQPKAKAEQAKAEAPAEKPAEAKKPEAKEAVAKPAEAKQLAKVELTETGAKFDPAIQSEQLSEGAWYCDMGTVHWAASKKPADGKCPECGMMLKEYKAATQAAQKAKAIEAKDDHAHDHDKEHGHDHGDHKH